MGKFGCFTSCLAIYAFFTWCPEVWASKHLLENKVNLGWPNFFNPEKAILRHARDHGKRQKYSENEKFEEALLNDNRIVNVIKDQDRNQWQNLEDLQIKDELRGLLVPLRLPGADLRSSPNLMEPEMLDSIKSELENTTDVYSLLSEVSDDGVRLGTPLFRRRYAPSLGKYGAEITFFDGPEPTSLLYYGNWCGRAGRVAPVDDIDVCCLQHAKCYGRGVRLCPDVWKKPYSTMYAWALLEEEPYCVRSDSTCVNTVCECDLEAALCLGLQLERLEINLEDDRTSFE